MLHTGEGPAGERAAGERPARERAKAPLQAWPQEHRCATIAPWPRRRSAPRREAARRPRPPRGETAWIRGGRAIRPSVTQRSFVAGSPVGVRRPVGVWRPWIWFVLVAVVLAAYGLAVAYEQGLPLEKRFVDSLKIFPSGYPGYAGDQV